MSKSKDIVQPGGVSAPPSGGQTAVPMGLFDSLTPTPVSQSKDGHPSGRHMIDGFRMMAMAAATSGGKYQKQLAEVYTLAALCIENEAARADRAEARLPALSTAADDDGGTPITPGASASEHRDEPKSPPPQETTEEA